MNAFAGKVAVVTGAIFGTRQAGEPSETRAPKGARLDIVYGRPLKFPMRAWPRDREMLVDAGEQIHEHLRSHVTWSPNASQPPLLPYSSHRLA